MLRAKWSAKIASTNTTSVLGVGKDELQLLAREPQVQRVHDAGAEEAGVVQLEVLVAVGRHHCEPVAALESELGVHGVGESQDAVAVLLEGGVVVAVVEADLGGPAVDGGQEGPVVDELSHGWSFFSGGVRGGVGGDWVLDDRQVLGHGGCVAP